MEDNSSRDLTYQPAQRPLKDIPKKNQMSTSWRLSALTDGDYYLPVLYPTE